MIHYHGTPLTPTDAASRFFRSRHAMVSFAYAQSAQSQLPLLAEVCQSFALDNGAFTAWKSDAPVTDWASFYRWVQEWMRHPGFDWALIPDVIEGDEAANDALVAEWPFCVTTGVPVWHLHESLDRLRRLCDDWIRVALGSSGEFATIGTRRWWGRMAEAMDAICDSDGFPATKLHGLRNETQKPEELIAPLIESSCPGGGLVLSPFAGSGTDGVVAKHLGRRAVLIELREAQCEQAALRVSGGPLFRSQEVSA